MKHLLCSFFLIASALQAEILCKGVVLLGSDAPLLSDKEMQSLDGVVFRDIAIPGSQEALSQKIEELYLCSPITQETPQEIKKTIRRYYEKQNHPLTEVLLPQQEITHGVIQVRILESRIARIEVEGARYASSQLFLNYLGVHPEETVDTEKLRQNVSFMNRNPFRHVNLIYSPGEKVHTTDLSLLVEERRPLRFFVGTDNTGVETTGRGRFLTGINWAKAFGLDHFLTYQYTSSYDFSSFQAHTAQYIAYLPWRNILQFFGGYSSVHAELTYPGSTNHGQSYQASGRYIVPLHPGKRLFHEWGLGFDFKRTNNTIEFSEAFPVVGSNVNLTQFLLHYEGNYAKEDYRFDFKGEFYFSPGSLVGDESNAAYNTLRPDAQNHWVYGRGSLKFFQRLTSSFSLFLCARGQLASTNLLPSEQLGLGGFDTVRGYDERQLNYDSGLILNGEIQTTPIPLFSRGKKNKNWKDALQILGFIDYGYGTNHTLIPGERKKDHLLGIGPAIRYTLDPGITARLDYGVKLHRESNFTGGSSMWYFSLIGSL